MAVETVTFSGELKRIEAARLDFILALQKLRKFILSDDFLVKFRDFEDILGDFEDKIITLVVEVENPVPELGLPPFEAVKQPPEGQPPQSEMKWNWWRFAAVAFINVISYVAVTERILSIPIFELILVMSIVMTLAPYLVTLVRGLWSREEEIGEEKAESVRLEDWVQETIDMLREKYKSARFLIKVQTQTKENLPLQYTSLNIDEAMYDRNKQFLETLPHEFLSQLGKIRSACNKNCWQRKQIVIGAIVAAKQFGNQMAGPQRGAGGAPT